MKSIERFGIGVLIVAACLGLVGCGDQATSETTPTPPPANVDDSDPGKALVEAKCSLCHTLERVENAKKTKDEWAATVDRMIGNGLVVRESEEQQIIDYLAARDAAR